MADNSATKDNKNNNRNPTLRDAERLTGRSGNAVHARDVEPTSGTGERRKEDLR